MNVNNFVKVVLSVSVFIFSLSALIYTTTPATADAPTTSYSTGKYQMQLQTEFNPVDKATYFYILVWNTETGRSKYYYGSTKKGKVAPAGSSFNLPSSPL